MEVIYSDEDGVGLQRSIFLAGPTPRDMETPSWRPGALKILEDLGFDGTVYVPERKARTRDYDYDAQVQWEWDRLHVAHTIVIWVPRELGKMPAFTTNVEFGFYLAKSPEKVLYGRPDWAKKTGYLDWMYRKVTSREPYSDLESLLKEVVNI